MRDSDAAAAAAALGRLALLATSSPSEGVRLFVPAERRLPAAAQQLLLRSDWLRLPERSARPAAPCAFKHFLLLRDVIRRTASLGRSDGWVGVTASIFLLVQFDTISSWWGNNGRLRLSRTATVKTNSFAFSPLKKLPECLGFPPHRHSVLKLEVEIDVRFMITEVRFPDMMHLMA